MPFFFRKKSKKPAQDEDSAKAAAEVTETSKNDEKEKAEEQKHVADGGADGTLLAAAIDFGTTYSGWAFSFRSDFYKDPSKVSTKNWIGGELISAKGPTCVLINPDGETLDSFGYEAESRYADLIERAEHEEWYFFRRFKMLLFDKQTLTRNVMIEDEGGKKLSAMKVFFLSIKYLRDDVYNHIKNSKAIGEIHDEEIHWVLTVPAIWNDAAKQFMREAAEEAGIAENKLTIALEPEVASLFCRHLPLEKSGSERNSLASFGPGKRYLVLDAGGGTVDITVHEVMEGGYLKELHKASGGDWGGTKVDDAFLDFLTDIAGFSVMPKLKAEHLEDYLHIWRNFEIKKRQISPHKGAQVTFRLPLTLVQLVEKTLQQPFESAIQNSKYSGQVTLMADKLRVDNELAKSFFESSINSIINHVSELLQESASRDVEAILMVGGFSESPMLQDAVRTSFPNLKIIIPDDAGLVVLKGAVIFGHSPSSISQRVSKFTYGTDVSVDFEETKHPLSRMRYEDGSTAICDGIFSTLVEVGQMLIVGEAQDEKIYSTSYADQTMMGMDIYATENKIPEFVDDIGCQKIGSFLIPVTGTGVGRQVSVQMIFGGTEIDVVCTEIATKIVHHLKIDCLSSQDGTT